MAKASVDDTVTVPPKYNPAKDKDGFMNPVMLAYFREKLVKWREELLRESSETIHNTLQSTELQQPDLADRASAEDRSCPGIAHPRPRAQVDHQDQRGADPHRPE